MPELVFILMLTAGPSLSLDGLPFPGPASSQTAEDSPASVPFTCILAVPEPAPQLPPCGAPQGSRSHSPPS